MWFPGFSLILSSAWRVVGAETSRVKVRVGMGPGVDGSIMAQESVRGMDSPQGARHASASSLEAVILADRARSDGS